MNQRSKIGPTAEEKNSWRCNSSEYNNRYHTFSLESQGHAKPAAVRKMDNRDTFRTGDEMFNQSSYMFDYAKKRLSRPNRVKGNLGPSSIAPDAGYKMDNCSPPPQGLGWQDNKEISLNSVSMRSYRPYTADEVDKSIRHPIIISPEYGAIDTNPETRPEMVFQTTVQKNFVKHDGCFRPPPAPGAIKTPANGIAGIAGADVNAKMDLTTTHFDAFKPKCDTEGIELVAVPPLLKDKSAKKPGWYRSIDSEKDAVSTQMHDYIVHSGVTRPKSFKPLLKYNKPSTEFHTKTLYKNAFTIHGNQRRKPMIPAARTKDDEIIKHMISKDALYDTEYHRIYRQHQHRCRPEAIVPKTTQKTGGTFYDATSYSQNYNCDAERAVARIPSFRPKKISDPWYKSTDTESQFRSTTRDHYTGTYARPATICRPKIKKDQGIGNVTREVHFDTEYSYCFAEAALIDNATPIGECPLAAV